MLTTGLQGGVRGLSIDTLSAENMILWRKELALSIEFMIVFNMR